MQISWGSPCIYLPRLMHDRGSVFLSTSNANLEVSSVCLCDAESHNHRMRRVRCCNKDLSDVKCLEERRSTSTNARRVIACETRPGIRFDPFFDPFSIVSDRMLAGMRTPHKSHFDKDEIGHSMVELVKAIDSHSRSEPL